MLDIRKLQALQAVARHGTIAAAARSLHFTAPAVSQQLAALERDADAALFVRTGRSIRLTEAGTVLAAHAALVLDQLHAANAALVAGRVPSGRLRVAAFPTAIAGVLAAAIADLRAHHPAVEVAVIEAEPERSADLLQAGEIDVSIVHHYDLVPRPVPAPVDSLALFDEPMLVVMAGSDDTVAGPVDLAALRAEPWIVPTVGGSCHEHVQRACGAAGFVPTVVAQCVDYASTLALVRAGCGVALVPELALHHVERNGLEVRETVVPLRRYVAVQRRAGNDSPAVLALVDSLRTVVAGDAMMHR